MINNITANELSCLLEAEGNGTILIDVREPLEFDTRHIPGSQLIPISGNLIEGLENLPPHINHWIFVCQHGMRSRKAAEIALTLGKPITISHVVGGVAAWAAHYPL